MNNITSKLELLSVVYGTPVHVLKQTPINELVNMYVRMCNEVMDSYTKKN